MHVCISTACNDLAFLNNDLNACGQRSHSLDKTRAVGTIAAIAAIAAMVATLFSNYLTCDIQNALIKLAALQYMFLQPCFIMIIASLSCYPMRDLMG